MDRNDIERLRDPGFTIARRGYDQREVDKLLGSLVDWLETDAAKQLGDVAVTRKLELVGKSTARILLTAEEESAQLRRATEEECDTLRSRAEAASLKVRQAADEYAANQRAKADEDARRTATAAHAKATEIVEEGERRRAQIEAVVIELKSQRDHTVQELERLRTELASAIGTHTAAARSEKSGPKPRAAHAETAKDADAAKARAKS
jgi:cell division septum initiation protein DivIVA